MNLDFSKGSTKLVLSSISILGLLLSCLTFAATSETGSTTMNATVTVFVDIVPSTWLDAGIQFGSVDPGTVGNAAQNNTDCGGTCYNITNDPGSNVDIDIYNDLNASIGTGLYVNESASVTDASSTFSTNTTITTSYTIIGDTSVNCTSIAAGDSCWIMYILDVDAGTTGGTKSTIYEYCGTEADQGSGACT